VSHGAIAPTRSYEDAAYRVRMPPHDDRLPEVVPQFDAATFSRLGGCRETTWWSPGPTWATETLPFLVGHRST
jgi:hypothetical protein